MWFGSCIAVAVVQAGSFASLIQPLSQKLPYAADAVVEGKKSLQTINAGEDVEKREPSYSVGGNVNWCNHCGEQYGDCFKH